MTGHICELGPRKTETSYQIAGHDLLAAVPLVVAVVDVLEVGVGEVHPPGGVVQRQAVGPVQLGADQDPPHGPVHVRPLDPGVLAPVRPEHHVDAAEGKRVTPGTVQDQHKPSATGQRKADRRDEIYIQGTSNYNVRAVSAVKLFCKQQSWRPLGTYPEQTGYERTCASFKEPCVYLQYICNSTDHLIHFTLGRCTAEDQRKYSVECRPDRHPVDVTLQLCEVGRRQDIIQSCCLLRARVQHQPTGTGDVLAEEDLPEGSIQSGHLDVLHDRIGPVEVASHPVHRDALRCHEAGGEHL